MSTGISALLWSLGLPKIFQGVWSSVRALTAMVSPLENDFMILIPTLIHLTSLELHYHWYIVMRLHHKKLSPSTKSLLLRDPRILEFVHA